MSRPGNILVITYWPLTDALITTYTLPYVRMIMKRQLPGSRVYLFTLSPTSSRKSTLFTQTVNSLEKENIISIDETYKPFGTGTFFSFIGIVSRLRRLVKSKQVTHLHAWCTPGGAIGWLLATLTGKPLVIDSFEPHAEAMVETGTWSRSGLPFRILFRLEKLQLKKAVAVICAAPGMMSYAKRTYGVAREERFVKPACVDLVKFPLYPDPRRENSGFAPDDIVCVYAGKFGGIYLRREPFDFFAAAHRHWAGKFRVLLLTSHSEQEVRDLCASAGLPLKIVTRRFVPHHEVPEQMAIADFAICPVKPIPTKRYCSPIKNGEYWALGLPVVITPNISIDSEIISRENAGAVLSEFSEAAYEQALHRIEVILSDPLHRSHIRQLAEKHRNPALAEEVYASIYG